MVNPGSLGTALAGALLGLALFSAAPGKAAATVIFEQVPTGSVNSPGVVSSGGVRAFDDFTLSAAARVTSVDWIGRSGPSDQFQIGFFANNPSSPFGLPVALPLFEVTVTAGLTPDAGFPNINHYTADLGSGFVLEADTRYWLSIRNVTPGVTFWGWNGDPYGISVGSNGASYSFNQLTLFFTLNSAPVAVPEPAAAGLLALGLAGLGAAALHRRRRR